MKEEIANVSAGVPGTGVTPAGKPAGFGDAIVNPKSAKTWKKMNAMLRRRSPVMEDEEKKPLLTKKVLGDYIKKASDNRSKNQADFDFYYKKKNAKKYGKAFRNVINRRKGIRAATDRLVKEETFAGAAIFEVSSKVFHNITLQKRKGKHWRTYLEEDDCYSEIREWARKHPKGKIVVRNECTGEMRYVKY